jgi:hypothetical protein
VARPQERKFLGFSFSAGPEVKRVIAPKAMDRFKRRVREITRRAKGVSMKTTIEELAPYMRGWRGYFGFCETPEVLIGLTRWVRLRLRAALWRQWKTPRRRRAALLALGYVRGWPATPLAAGSALGTSRRPRPCLWGFLMRISNRWDFRHCSRSVSVTDSNRRVLTRTHGGVPMGRFGPPIGMKICGRWTLAQTARVVVTLDKLKP